ncbi:ABC-2 transporter permease [Ruminococcus sp. CLA-AA-H200]|uniref:ABC-2 transporter permease n=1 Tax=Ruminococcus turbiniformis TaxID=2881258 RepID=A0ABS8FXS3_9FIRM|nr:ABC-2 transporter permease [Ruminococcus turbiniformis]MCC2254853.1 ABC-2 transporter permease [Ruminococcus turbiniformis]
MKGLLIKDIKLLKNQGKTLIITLFVLGIVWGAMNANPLTIVSYVTVILAIFTVSTISYDEYENCYLFLFTLPVTRKQYTVEKYVFTLLLVVGAWLISMAVGIVIWAVQGMETSLSEVVLGGCLIAPIALLFDSVLIPVRLKFDGERGKLVIPIVAGGVALLVVCIYQILEKIPGNVLGDLVAAANRLGVGELGAIFGVAAVVALIISFLCSMHVMEKKEF